jgi:hypothetical protein
MCAIMDFFNRRLLIAVNAVIHNSFVQVGHNRILQARRFLWTARNLNCTQLLKANLLNTNLIPVI